MDIIKKSLVRISEPNIFVSDIPIIGKTNVSGATKVNKSSTTLAAYKQDAFLPEGDYELVETEINGEKLFNFVLVNDDDNDNDQVEGVDEEPTLA